MMQPAQYTPTIDVPCPLNGARHWRILLQGEMRTDLVVQHDDGTPTGSRSTSFFIRGILGPDVRSIFMRWLRRLGVRLLQRTTRQVSPTLDGEAYYQRCVSLIADMEDAEGAFVGAKPSGQVRVDVHGTLARHFLLPDLPRFRQQYPDIRLHLSEAHQPLDMIREGFDCILRAGELSDSPLIRRRLALLERGTFASPDYLRRFCMPRTPDDLAGHEMVGWLSPDTGDIVPLVFGAGGNTRQLKLPAMVTV